MKFLYRFNIFLLENNLNFHDQIIKLFPLMIKSAQEVYNEWEQDEDGNDDIIIGSGGICDEIAEKISNILSEHNISSFTLYNEHDTHTSVYAYSLKEKICYNIDIPYSYYEKGYLYTWKKIPNVIFDKNMVTISLVDYDDYIDDKGNIKNLDY